MTTRDMPDFTTKSNIDIIAQTVDKLVVMAPEAKAVNIGITILRTVDFETYTALSPGASYKVLEVYGRGKVFGFILFAFSTSDTSPIDIRDISWRLWIDQTEPTWWMYLTSHDVWSGGVGLAYLSGKTAGIYFPPCFEHRPTNILVIKTLATAPTFDPIADFPLSIRYVGFSYMKETEFMNNFGLRVRHAGSSSNELRYRGYVFYGVYP